MFSMTVDGVNNVPVLRSDHVGVFIVKYGTYVACNYSKMIISNDNFTTIYVAVK